MQYVIAGFGKFGKIALDRLMKAFPLVRVTIVDPKVDARPDLPPTVQWIAADAVSFLANSNDLERDDVIIPMVPFHLAAAWLMARSSDVAQSQLPEALHALIPHPYPIDRYNLCASRADFLCPDDCPEGDRCTVTGEPRDPLFSEIEGVELPGVSILALRSFQILPGVGGYAVGDLLDLEERMTPGRYVLATSCKCHAILSGLEKTR